MREIKFRAWEKLIKRWYSPIYRAYEGQLEELNIGMSGRLSLRTISGTSDESTFKDRFVLMQYTGLKDKNGKEIYEGDILAFYTRDGSRITKRLAVKWEVSKLGFNITHKPLLEVIGNIYENPELLA